jgi:endonuclease-3 related protein
MSSKLLLEMYERLFEHFGPQGWWPAETPFEVCVGAILTQGTTWKNVEKAIQNLKAKGLLSPRALYQLDQKTLAELIRPCGYYNVKAKRLKNFISFLVEKYEGEIERLRGKDLKKVRDELLGVSGLGKETVDSILLYALDYPIFVVDAYTYRILHRHSLAPEEITYDELQEFFMNNLPSDLNLFKEFHALLVACGKTYCKAKSPSCNGCPLGKQGD